MKKHPRAQRPPQRRWTLLLLLLSLNACLGRPTYSKEKIAESVEKICRDEYELDTDARLVGKTLYLYCQLESLTDPDLQLDEDTMKKLEGAMMSVTRVALSTDAEVDFLVVKAREAGVGMMMTLIRYFPDVKGIIYTKFSRDEFQDRLIFEIDHAEKAEDPAEWKDMALEEFVTRLVCSRVERRFSSNPLLSAFLQVRRLDGRLEGGVLTLSMEQSGDSQKSLKLTEELLKTGVAEAVQEAMAAYPEAPRIERVRIQDTKGKMLLELTEPELKEIQKESAKNVKKA
jgi:hypothetical protein